MERGWRVPPPSRKWWGPVVIRAGIVWFSYMCIHKQQSSETWQIRKTGWRKGRDGQRHDRWIKPSTGRQRDSQMGSIWFMRWHLGEHPPSPALVSLSIFHWQRTGLAASSIYAECPPFGFCVADDISSSSSSSSTRISFGPLRIWTAATINGTAAGGSRAGRYVLCLYSPISALAFLFCFHTEFWPADGEGHWLDLGELLFLASYPYLVLAVLGDRFWRVASVVDYVHRGLSWWASPRRLYSAEYWGASFRVCLSLDTISRTRPYMTAPKSCLAFGALPVLRSEL